MKDKLATGIIGSSFGVKGFVKIYPYSDDRKHFLSLSQVNAEKNGKKKELTIEECELAKDCILVHFKGFDNPEIARTLTGFVILVDRQEAAPLKKGEQYVADIIGLDLVYDGHVVGKVASVSEGLQGLLLEITTEESGTHLVPYLDRYFGKVDLDSGTLEFKEIMLLS
jgi:16S rRNA processing protein RimM